MNGRIINGKAALCLGTLLGALFLSGQQPPQFEVAVVKQSPPPAGNLININLGTFRNGRLTFGNASLSDLLKFAWSLASNEQLEGTDWMTSQEVRFDIEARAPVKTPREEVALMLQSLLIERLKLAVHREQKTRSYLALVPGKNPPKLGDAEPTGSNTAAGGKISANRMSMQSLAMLLSRFERQTIVDRTGIPGEHRFHLEWATNNALQHTVDALSGPSLYTAVDEQLGLKLESRKGPLDVLVVDHAEKIPIEN
jgi:uncharacterized protein (TIGR03435 family)